MQAPSIQAGLRRFEEPPADIQERLRCQEHELVVLPAAAIEALRLTQDPDCSISQFASIIEKDLKLASDLLSLANSALYAPSSPIASLNQAVVRLGFRQCKNLIITSSMTSLMKRIPLEEQWIRDVLWRHSLATAINAHHLNRVLGLGLQGEEFAAGLVHDFGRTLFAVALPDRFAQIDPLDFEEAADVSERERLSAGIDHANLGAWFFHRSGLPDTFVEVALDHHDCSAASALTALTAAADHLANHLQKYLDPSQYQPAENRGIQRLEQLGWRNASALLKETAVTILEEAANDLIELTRRM